MPGAEEQDRHAAGGQDQAGREHGTGQGEDAFDSQWREFLHPVATLQEIELRGLKLKNLQPAYLRHLVAGLGGRESIQPTKLAEMLGCSYNTLVAALAKDA